MDQLDDLQSIDNQPLEEERVLEKLQKQRDHKQAYQKEVAEIKLHPTEMSTWQLLALYCLEEIDEVFIEKTLREAYKKNSSIFYQLKKFLTDEYYSHLHYKLAATEGDSCIGDSVAASSCLHEKLTDHYKNELQHNPILTKMSTSLRRALNEYKLAQVSTAQEPTEQPLTQLEELQLRQQLLHGFGLNEQTLAQLDPQNRLDIERRIQKRIQFSTSSGPNKRYSQKKANSNTPLQILQKKITAISKYLSEFQSSPEGQTHESWRLTKFFEKSLKMYGKDLNGELEIPPGLQDMAYNLPASFEYQTTIRETSLIIPIFPEKIHQTLELAQEVERKIKRQEAVDELLEDPLGMSIEQLFCLWCLDEITEKDIRKILYDSYQYEYPIETFELQIKRLFSDNPASRALTSWKSYNKSMHFLTSSPWKRTKYSGALPEILWKESATTYAHQLSNLPSVLNAQKKLELLTQENELANILKKKQPSNSQLSLKLQLQVRQITQEIIVDHIKYLLSIGPTKIQLEDITITKKEDKDGKLQLLAKRKTEEKEPDGQTSDEIIANAIEHFLERGAYSSYDLESISPIIETLLSLEKAIKGDTSVQEGLDILEEIVRISTAFPSSDCFNKCKLHHYSKVLLPANHFPEKFSSLSQLSKEIDQQTSRIKHIRHALAQLLREKTPKLNNPKYAATVNNMKKNAAILTLGALAFSLLIGNSDRIRLELPTEYQNTVVATIGGEKSSGYWYLHSEDQKPPHNPEIIQLSQEIEHGAPYITTVIPAEKTIYLPIPIPPDAIDGNPLTQAKYIPQSMQIANEENGSFSAIEILQEGDSYQIRNNSNQEIEVTVHFKRINGENTLSTESPAKTTANSFDLDQLSLEAQNWLKKLQATLDIQKQKNPTLPVLDHKTPGSIIASTIQEHTIYEVDSYKWKDMTPEELINAFVQATNNDDPFHVQCTGASKIYSALLHALQKMNPNDLRLKDIDNAIVFLNSNNDSLLTSLELHIIGENDGEFNEATPSNILPNDPETQAFFDALNSISENGDFPEYNTSTLTPANKVEQLAKRLLQLPWKKIALFLMAGGISKTLYNKKTLLKEKTKTLLTSLIKPVVMGYNKLKKRTQAAWSWVKTKKPTVLSTRDILSDNKPITSSPEEIQTTAENTPSPPNQKTNDQSEIPQPTEKKDPEQELLQLQQEKLKTQSAETIDTIKKSKKHLLELGKSLFKNNQMTREEKDLFNNLFQTMNALVEGTPNTRLTLNTLNINDEASTLFIANTATKLEKLLNKWLIIQDIVIVIADHHKELQDIPAYILNSPNNRNDLQKKLNHKIYSMLKEKYPEDKASTYIKLAKEAKRLAILPMTTLIVNSLTKINTQITDLAELINYRYNSSISQKT